MSKEYTPSLEDFLQFEDSGMDNEVTDDLNDPLDNNTGEANIEEEVQTEEDPITIEEEVIEEIVEEAGKTTTTEETTEEEVEEESKEEGEEETTSPGQLETIYSIMDESGLLSLEEGFEFDGSIDKLIEAVNQTKENLEVQAAQTLWNRLPENFRTILEYGIAGGTDLEAVKEVVNNQIDLNRIDIENENHQRKIVETYLKKTTKFSDTKIKRRIQMLYDSDLLEEEASEVYPDLKVFQEEERLKVVEEESKQRQVEQKHLEEAYTTFTNIASDMPVSDTRKQQIVEAVWASAKYDGENESSYMEYVDDTIRNNPEHFAQLVNIYLDYDSRKGFNVTGKSSRKANTQAAKNLRNTLQDLLSGNASVIASSTLRDPGDTSGFDFEKFIKHSN